VKLESEQVEAFQRACAFLRAKRVSKPYFCLQGLAGTGKTEVLAALGREFPEALPVAPIGKAASVLSRRMGREAETVHAAIYQFLGEHEGDDGERYMAFKSRIKEGTWDGRKVLLDEAGCVGTDLAADLLATGCRVVATGDPGQLRPVRAQRFFEEPDFALAKVRRQALESAVLRQAHSVRQTGTYSADGPDFRVGGSVARDDILAADVILCWRNATRQALNGLVRAHKGLSGPPGRGETVVCLRNSRDYGVMNGARYVLEDDYDPLRRTVTLSNERGERVNIRDAWFEGIDAACGTDEMQERLPFCFGYAMTVHKCIGSEFEQGILVDEYCRDDARREWLYTGLTRFSKQVLVYSAGAQG
jgi:exodeoxyribonuclease-5